MQEVVAAVVAQRDRGERRPNFLRPDKARNHSSGLTVGLTCCHFLPKRIGKLEHSLNVYTLTSDTWGTSRGDDCSRRMAKAILMRVRGRSATYDHLRTHFALVYSKLHGKFIR
jgi:hypothetical protein